MDASSAASYTLTSPEVTRRAAIGMIPGGSIDLTPSACQKHSLTSSYLQREEERGERCGAVADCEDEAPCV